MTEEEEKRAQEREKALKLAEIAQRPSTAEDLAARAEREARELAAAEAYNAEQLRKMKLSKEEAEAEAAAFAAQKKAREEEVRKLKAEKIAAIKQVAAFNAAKAERERTFSRQYTSMIC